MDEDKVEKVGVNLTQQQVDDTMFWLRSGMGSREDKQFLMQLIHDLRAELKQCEEWQKNAHKKYDEKCAELEALKHNIRDLIEGRIGSVRPISKEQMEAALIAEVIADNADGRVDAPYSVPVHPAEAQPQYGMSNGSRLGGLGPVNSVIPNAYPLA